MGSIGFGELILILVVAAVVLGPEKLPELAKQAGKAVRDLRQELRGMEESVKQDVDIGVELKEIDSLREEVKELKKELKLKR